MSGNISFSKKMIDRALSKFVLYWNPPGHPQYGRRWVTWSIDTTKDRKNKNHWPAIQRWARELQQRYAGEYTSIMVYAKDTDKLLLKIDKKGRWYYEK